MADTNAPPPAADGEDLATSILRPKKRFVIS